MRSNEQYLLDTISRLESELTGFKNAQTIGQSSHRSYKYFTSNQYDFYRSFPAGVSLEQYRVTYKLDSQAKFQAGAVVRARHFASATSNVMVNFRPPWAIGSSVQSSLQSEPVTDPTKRTYLLNVYGNGVLSAQDFYFKFFFYGTSPGTIESIVRTI
jgi:hypothetical protein